MTEIKSLRCELITPDRQVLGAEATSVVFPAHDGQIGILKNRAPLLCKMGIGTCRISTEAGMQRYYVDGGFARMLNNRLTLLTQEARSPEEIDRSAADKALAEARARSAADPDAQEARRLAIQRASSQLKLAGG